MDPKFIKLEEAAEQLNISPDHLNALREENKLRAYRDGSSWKFRTEDIEKFASDGVPELEAEESGVNLDLDSLSLDDSKVGEASANGSGLSGLDVDSSDDSSLSDLTLDDDESDLELDLSTGNSADLEIDLDDEADTSDAAAAKQAESAEALAAAESDELELAEPMDLPDDDSAVTQVSRSKPDESATGSLGGDEGSALDLELESDGDDPESILLSEAELGDSDRPPSTIIGKSELDDALDLDLAGSESGSDPAMSDVRLADDDDDLELDPSATGEMPVSQDVTGDFDDVEDLGIDLEAESSRILAPEDVAAAQAAGSQAQQKSPETSDLELDLDDDYDLAATSDTGLSGLSSIGDDESIVVSGSEINLEGSDAGQASGAGLTGLSALELDDDDDDDDFVLGDGSDLTLSSADSGINLSPGDSGLSLDDAASDLAGSAMTSGIDFSEASGLMSDEPAGDFELTPMAEDAADEDDEDSSQVIALDAFEDGDQDADGLLSPAGGGAMPAAAGFGQAATVPRAEVQFTGWQVFFLTLCLILLTLCGMMALDVIRSIWSWDEPYGVNSTLIDSLRGFLFP